MIRWEEVLLEKVQKLDVRRCDHEKPFPFDRIDDHPCHLFRRHGDLEEKVPGFLGCPRIGVNIGSLDQACVDCAGANDAHAYAVLFQVIAQYLGNPHQRVLAPRIRGMPRQADDPGGGLYGYDVTAAPGADHFRNKAFDPVDHTPEIDPDHLFPVRMAHLFDLGKERYPCHVHEDIQGAES